MSVKTAAIILAAGKGTRMGGDIPKVLCNLADKPLIHHVTGKLYGLGIRDICVVVGPDVASYSVILADKDIRVSIQNQRRGTGDAVAAAAGSFAGVRTPFFADGLHYRGEPISSEYCLVCYGDVPAVPEHDLQKFINEVEAGRHDLGLIAMNHPHPDGYGRVLVDKAGKLAAIVEEKDASPDEKLVKLCNTGIVLVATEVLFRLLDQLNAENAQNEYYLTDIVKIAYDEGLSTHVYQSNDYQSFDGVNTPEQLQAMERWYKSRVSLSGAQMGEADNLM